MSTADRSGSREGLHDVGPSREPRVAVVTNDQGQALVDTHLCRGEIDAVGEITGGWFCRRYDELEAALEEAREGGATAALLSTWRPWSRAAFE